MEKTAHFILRHRKAVLNLFITLALFGAVSSLFVINNYNMVDYLPDEAQSTTAIELLQDEFGGELPNARAMVSGLSIREALAYKDKLSSIYGVSSVTWLDDVLGSGTLSSVPIEFLDRSITDKYYKDNTALFDIAIESGLEKTAVAAIRELIGEDNYLAGESVNSAESQEMSFTEVVKAMAILIPAIIVILLLTTTSWLEPILFLASIGVAVLINMGTNVFFGELSFITLTISPILQIAVSLDCAIFLLHSFGDFRKDHPPEQAMVLAMKKAVTAVAASAGTTVMGFLALLFMRFRVGPDLGINLVKGIIISFISIMVFLPALTLTIFPLLEKARHRSILPDLGRIGKLLAKVSTPFMVIVIIIAVPVFLAQSNIEFQYGTGSISAETRAGEDKSAIDEVFGNDNTLVLLVPKSGDAGAESELCEALGSVTHVTSVVSYTTAVGSEIPTEYLPPKNVDQFYSENFARIIIYTNIESEGAEAFAAVKSILDTADTFYGKGTYFLAGQSATLYDMSTVVSKDTTNVSIAAIIGIFLILLVSFRSPVLPLLLIFTIESAIWLNLSFAYFSGQSFNFIGYLVISTVQLGATVDYAILMTDRYLRNRKEMPAKESMYKAASENLKAILISAAILSGAGFILAATSTNMIISQLGLLLGRGTVLSFLMVVLVLPALLITFDKAVNKVSIKNR